jgi:hypothetical protein
MYLGGGFSWAVSLHLGRCVSDWPGIADMGVLIEPASSRLLRRLLAGASQLGLQQSMIHQLARMLQLPLCLISRSWVALCGHVHGIFP